MKRVLFVALLCTTSFGQTVPAAFEVADVRVSAPSSNPTMRGGIVRGGRYEVRTATMVDLISMAYSLEPNQVFGGPNWLDWERFDVAAKVPAGTPRENVGAMLQNLLAGRFKLVLHKDTRPMPAFSLSLGTGKPKMKEASGDARQGCQGMTQNPTPDVVPNQVLSCRSVTMAVFAYMLRAYNGGTYLPDPVVDQTGLTGEWDVELKWTPRNRLAQAGPDAITLFDAIDKQLGLRLEAKKLALPVLVVDSVNQNPTPNDPAATKLLPPPPPTEFEVASIRPSSPDARGHQGAFKTDV